MNKYYLFVERISKEFSKNYKKINKKIVNGLLYSVGLLTLLFLVIRYWNDLIEIAFEANIIWLILVILLYPIGMIPTTFVWHNLLKSVSIEINYFDNLRYYCLSTFSRHIPGFIFFIGNRSLVYSDENVSTKKILFVTLLESLVLSLVGFIISIPLIILMNDMIRVDLKILIVSFCLVATVSIFILILRSFTKNKEREIIIFQKKIYFPEIKLPLLLKTMLFAIFAWFGGGLLLSFVVVSISELSLYNMLFSIGVWAFVGSLSMSVGIIIQGFGIREVTMALLLSTIMNPIEAAAASIGFRVLFTLGELLWVTIFTFTIKPRKII